MPVHKFDGTNMSPNPPKHIGSETIKLVEPHGVDAGGTENMKADQKSFHANHSYAPENGSAKFRPSGVHVCYGTSVKGSVASKPASKTKSPQNAT